MAPVLADPHEVELCFPPLTSLEVLGSRVDGSLLIISVRLAVNLTALTIEQVVCAYPTKGDTQACATCEFYLSACALPQVIGKRKKLLDDMVRGIRDEVRGELVGSGFEQYGVMLVDDELGGRGKPTVDGNGHGAVAHADEWYNDDDNFEKALNGVMDTKRAVLCLETRLPLLAKHLSPEQWASLMPQVTQLLSDSRVEVRSAAATAFSRFDQAAKLTHVPTLLSMQAELQAKGDQLSREVRRSVLLVLSALRDQLPSTTARAGDALPATMTSSTLLLDEVQRGLFEGVPRTCPSSGAQFPVVKARDVEFCTSVEELEAPLIGKTTGRMYVKAERSLGGADALLQLAWPPGGRMEAGTSFKLPVLFSPIGAVTLPDEVKGQLGMPLEADHFGFVYPVSTHLIEEQFRLWMIDDSYDSAADDTARASILWDFTQKMQQASPWTAAIFLGGYVYFSSFPRADGGLDLRVNAMNVFANRVSPNDTVLKHVRLGTAQFLPKNSRALYEKMRKSGRLTKVTFPSFFAAGITHFSWILPGESLSVSGTHDIDHEGRSLQALASGGFVYFHERNWSSADVVCTFT